MVQHQPSGTSEQESQNHRANAALQPHNNLQQNALSTKGRLMKGRQSLFCEASQH